MTNRPEMPESYYANQNALLDRLTEVISRCQERQVQAQAIIDTPNSEINSRPAPHIVALARISKRQERDIMNLARLAGSLTESADTGTD